MLVAYVETLNKQTSQIKYFNLLGNVDKISRNLKGVLMKYKQELRLMTCTDTGSSNEQVRFEKQAFNEKYLSIKNHTLAYTARRHDAARLLTSTQLFTTMTDHHEIRNGLYVFAIPQCFVSTGR